MQLIKNITLLFLLISFWSSGNAQIMKPEQLALYVEADENVQVLLNKLLLEDAFLKLFQARKKMQQHKTNATDALPDPELGFDFSPQPMQKEFNRTYAVRLMQPFPWPGTVYASTQIEKEKEIYEDWVELDAINSRFFEFMNLLAEREWIIKQKQLAQEQIGWVKSLKNDLLTKLSTSDARTDLLDLEIEEQTRLLELAEWNQNEKNNLIKLNAFFAQETTFPDSIYTSRREAVIPDVFRNPLLELAAIKSKIGNKTKILAEKEGMPGFSLGAEYMWFDKAMPMPNMRSSVNVMAVVSLPIYRQKYSERSQEAIQQKIEADFERESQERQLMARYQNLIEMQLTKRKEYRLYNDEIPRRLEEKMLIEQERLENGLGSISAWIEIKQKLVEQTGKALDVRFALKQIDLELKWIHIVGMTE